MVNLSSCYPDRSHLTPRFSKDLVFFSHCHQLWPRFWDGISEHLFRTGETFEGAQRWLRLPSDCRRSEKTVCNLRRHGCNYLCSVECPLPPLSMATCLPTRVGGSTLNEHICHRNATLQTPSESKHGLIMNPDTLGHPFLYAEHSQCRGGPVFSHVCNLLNLCAPLRDKDGRYLAWSKGNNSLNLQACCRDACQHVTDQQSEAAGVNNTASKRQ